jgi:hypothetical protein
MAGQLIICFDYELAWGRFDEISLAEYRPRFLVERKTVIPELLRILSKHRISATWAVVGHIMLTECDGAHTELDPYRPAQFPDWFAREAGGKDDGNSVWMARDTVEAIAACEPEQEIASHTFSHVEFGNEALTPLRARQELELTRVLIEGFSRRMVSHVFPRGVPGHLDALKESGIKVYRMHSPGDLGRSTAYTWKLQRFMGEALAIAPPLSIPRIDSYGMTEIAGGLQLSCRGRWRKMLPAGQRITRALRGIRHASRTGGIFYLWSHPADFAENPPVMLAMFDEICRRAALLRDAGRLEIIPLQGLAEASGRTPSNHWREL